MTIEGIKSLSDPESVANIKRYAEEFLNSNKYNVNNPMDGNYSIAYKNHILRVTEALKTARGLEFIAIQGALKAMNPGPIGSGKILNPLTPFGPPPGMEGIATDSLDVPVSSMNPGEERSAREDFLKLQSLKINSEYSQRKINLYDSENKSTDVYYIDNDQPESENANGTMREQVIAGISVSKPDYSKIFEKKSYGFDFGSGQKGHTRFEPKTQARKKKSQAQLAKEKTFENQDTFFHFAELRKGYITDEQYTEIGIEDGSNYMPFFLEDLRSNGKRIYFRAFFKNLRESIAPSWTQEQYFGRVDPVGIYMGTSRSVSVAFSMVAFSPEGFTVLWRKLNQLAKLLYPTFSNGIMIKSPVSRLRIGDVICDSSGNGLTGYISSPVELDYSDATWETSQWLGFSESVQLGKAPQMVNVSFTFQVIHESAPQIDPDFNFDTSMFRRIGELDELNVGTLDEDVGEDSANEDGTR